MPLFQRLGTGLPAKAWEVVPNSNPLRMIREVVMRLRLAVDLVSEIRQHDVDLIRMMGRLAEQRAAAHIAKGPAAMIRGVMNTQVLVPRNHAKLSIRHSDPGYISGAMHSPAHRAMTMGAEKSRQRYLKRYRSAKT